MIQNALQKVILFRKKTKAHDEIIKNNSTDYFTLAKQWSDDFYATAVASRNRWRAFCLIGLLPLFAISLLSTAMLIPMQHLEPLLINHYSDGFVSVRPLKQPVLLTNPAEVQSDIVRYIIARESYSAFSYKSQYDLVVLLSSNKVADDYAAQQSATRANAPINRLKNKGKRTAHVISVLFLDSEDKNNPARMINFHKNLAQVNFTVTTKLPSGAVDTLPYTALISWKYQGTPSDSNDAWQNWNGFTVTGFQLQQRVLSQAFTKY